MSISQISYDFTNLIFSYSCAGVKYEQQTFKTTRAYHAVINRNRRGRRSLIVLVQYLVFPRKRAPNRLIKSHIMTMISSFYTIFTFHPMTMCLLYQTLS